MKFSEENDICNEIIRYGKDIINSEVFRKTAAQKHHVNSTVFEHTINVCVVALRLCRQLKRRGINVSEKDVIQAALCHDLGMIDRESRYKHLRDTWRSHPEESAKTARELIPDLSPEAEEMIRSHMWPLSGNLPRTQESMILCIADKYASMADWSSWLTRQRFADRIKKQLEEKATSS